MCQQISGCLSPPPPIHCPGLSRLAVSFFPRALPFPRHLRHVPAGEAGLLSIPILIPSFLPLLHRSYPSSPPPPPPFHPRATQVPAGAPGLLLCGPRRERRRRPRPQPHLHPQGVLPQAGGTQGWQVRVLCGTYGMHSSEIVQHRAQERLPANLWASSARLHLGSGGATVPDPWYLSIRRFLRVSRAPAGQRPVSGHLSPQPARGWSIGGAALLVNYSRPDVHSATWRQPVGGGQHRSGVGASRICGVSTWQLCKGL